MSVRTLLHTGNAADPGRIWVAVEPGLKFPRYADIAVRDDPRTTLDLDIALVFNENQGWYEVDHLTAYRRTPRDRVDGTALRTIPVKEFTRELGWAAHLADTGEAVPHPLPDDLVQRLREQGPSDSETLMWVGRVYVTANATGQPPGQAVRDTFDLATPTASVWIRRARDRGYIPDTWSNAFQMTTEDFELARSALRDDFDG